MARDSTPYVREAAIALLKAAPTIAALAPGLEGRVYPPQRPAKVQWPFIGYGQPVTGPFGAACLDGCLVTVAIHAFAETEGEGDATIDGEALANRITAAIAELLDGATLDLMAHSSCPYPATAHFTWTGSQRMQDGAEADAFHAWASFDITVSS